MVRFDFLFVFVEFDNIEFVFFNRVFVYKIFRVDVGYVGVY